ncbi:MAG TPA: helix-turn-helix domain-containing protein [Acidimicrobiales bacterium]|nr:helix-turn-helix domain-containing protein [Acidimicrobiales bacterium]
MTSTGFLFLDDLSLRHLAKALDQHALWCRTNAIPFPRGLETLRTAANHGQHERVVDDPGATLDTAKPMVLLDYDHAAAALCVSERTVRRLVKEGELPAVTVGKQQRRIHRDDLEAYATRLRAAAAEVSAGKVSA